ncbi:hypothetical protein R5H32_05725 [Defluviimonas sp. D31]|uniref:hypothetical protein n=1 Tax=Defluviimonas sp. D31 TaxID=3083253 RepID=UPI00296F5ABE|nr:hypothetical protein [Defluviimonas sp. D31]MDW4548848.1 hypothetical protein [Defluviimonas sp. D31]
MNTPSNDSTSSAETTTLTKSQLFERFLETERRFPSGHVSRPEDVFDFCDAVLNDQSINLTVELPASDDPEWQLEEIIAQITGCVRDLEEILAEFRRFAPKMEDAA